MRKAKLAGPTPVVGNGNKLSECVIDPSILYDGWKVPVAPARLGKNKFQSIAKFAGDGENAVRSLPETNVLKHLQAPAQQDDAYAWMQAWHAIDQGPLKTLLSLGQQAQLSLCGETQAHTYQHQPQTLWQRLRKRMQPPSVASVLLTL